MFKKEEISRRNFKAGYVLVKSLNTPPEEMEVERVRSEVMGGGYYYYG